jgi:hypothetical protein
MSGLGERESESDPQLVWATMRLNTWVFGLILGLIGGLLLSALALVAALASGEYLGLTVTLIGIFVPGYGPGWDGALAGLFWGFLGGGLLGAGVYRITTRNALTRLDELVAFERGDRDFPAAVLRLHGPSLGLAIGVMGALGLIGTTSWLVIRGTAAHSVHARLLSEILPGYSVDLPGSVVGAAELFVVLYLVCQVLAFVYNRVASARRRRA